MVPVAKLIAQIRADRALMKPSITKDVLHRVRAGHRASAHTPNWVVTYLDS
jgi:hypothetical protein